MTEELTDKEKRIITYSVTAMRGSLGFTLWRGGGEAWHDEDIDNIIKKMGVKIKND